MDIYKLKFTRLQNEILRFLSIRVGSLLSLRAIAKELKVSATAVSKAIRGLEKEQLVKLKKEGEMNVLLTELNRDNSDAVVFKRSENLKLVHESGLVDFLEGKFPGSVIVLFGSYSYGEDTIKSDIDIAVIGSKQKDIDLNRFEKILEREININFYPCFADINKNLKSNIFNGIVLVGRINL